MKAIARATAGAPGLSFYSVQKCLGNAYFSLRNAKGEDIRGTPRGLFTKGTMKISVGQIVVAEGDRLGLEIVGVINERSTAETLVKSGSMPREVLIAASAAGAYTTVSSVEEDDIFEGEEKEEIEHIQAPSKNDTSRSVIALASRLASTKSVKAKPVNVENGAEDVSAAAEHDAFADPKRVKSKSTTSSRLSIPMRPAIQDAATASEATVWDYGVDVDTYQQDYTTATRLSHKAPTSWDDDVDIDAI